MYKVNTVDYLGKPCVPSKVVCVGRNYLDHVNELGNEVPAEPVIFVKPNSAIGNELISGRDPEIHYEAELCFLVKQGKLAGIGVGLDLTKRHLQTILKQGGLPWERAKAFDNAAVFSEFVAIPDNIQSISLSLQINGSLRQQGAVVNMIYPPEFLLNNISDFMTLTDNDIIMTGTPSGVGMVQKGQVFEAKVMQGSNCLVCKQWIAA